MFDKIMMTPLEPTNPTKRAVSDDAVAFFSAIPTLRYSLLRLSLSVTYAPATEGPATEGVSFPEEGLTVVDEKPELELKEHASNPQLRNGRSRRQPNQQTRKEGTNFAGYTTSTLCRTFHCVKREYDTLTLTLTQGPSPSSEIRQPMVLGIVGLIKAGKKLSLIKLSGSGKIAPKSKASLLHI